MGKIAVFMRQNIIEANKGDIDNLLAHIADKGYDIFLPRYYFTTRYITESAVFMKDALEDFIDKIFSEVFDAIIIYNIQSYDNRLTGDEKSFIKKLREQDDKTDIYTYIPTLESIRTKNLGFGSIFKYDTSPYLHPNERFVNTLENLIAIPLYNEVGKNDIPFYFDTSNALCNALKSESITEAINYGVLKMEYLTAAERLRIRLSNDKSRFVTINPMNTVLKIRYVADKYLYAEFPLDADLRAKIQEILNIDQMFIGDMRKFITENYVAVARSLEEYKNIRGPIRSICTFDLVPVSDAKSIYVSEDGSVADLIESFMHMKREHMPVCKKLIDILSVVPDDDILKSLNDLWDKHSLDDPYSF